MERSQKIPHALLFSGPGGIGKFRMARHFAQLINSSDSEAIREIEKNICPDVQVIGDLWQAGKLESWEKISQTSQFDQRHRTGKEGESPKRTNTIGIRDIQSFLAPFFRTRNIPIQVGIIRDAERLTVEAGNALLKTLEDPPKGTLFLLTTRYHGSLPETIVSRCQMMSFSLHPQEVLKKYLLDTPIGEPNSAQMLMLSQGRSEYLFRILEEQDFYESEKQQFQEISRMFFCPSPLQKIKLVDSFSLPEKSESLVLMIENLARFLRSILVEKASQTESLAIARQISSDQIITLYHALLSAQKGLRANANKKLLLEQLFFQIP